MGGDDLPGGTVEQLSHQSGVLGKTSRSLEGNRMERFGPSLLRLFEPCAATTFDRQVPFSQVAFAVWKCKRLGRLCFRIRHPPEVSACESMPLLRRRETSGTLAPLRRVPSFERLNRRNCIS